MKIISFSSDICQDLTQALRKEWLETNQFGGSASSTIISANTRRQHGLLVAQLRPPLGQFLLLSNLDEVLFIDDVPYPLSTRMHNDTVSPEGFANLKEFRLLPFPTWTYCIEDLILQKEIIFPRDEQTVIVRYQLLEGDDTLVRLELRPLTTSRHIQSLARRSDRLSTKLDVKPGRIGFAGLYFHHDAAILDQLGSWYCKVQYPEDKNMGLDFEEDLYSPFRLVYTFTKGREVFLCASLEEREAINLSQLVLKEETRKHGMLKNIRVHDSRFQILAYSGQFLLINPFKYDCFSLPILEESGGKPKTKSTGKSSLISGELPNYRFTMQYEKDSSKTIIKTGYHTPSESTREQLISLHGLAFTTNQHDLARHVLAHLAGQVSKGLLPDRPADHSEAFLADKYGTPDYGAMDVPMWLIHDSFEYLKYSGDRKFVEEKLFHILASVIESFTKGTDFGIHVDSDGLLSGGEKGKALTWMNAKAGNVSVMPRGGKPVEIQALWYNALMSMAHMADLFENDSLKKSYQVLAKRAQESFTRIFWDSELGYLYDRVNGKEKDKSLRPNQLLALGLPFPILEQDSEKWNSILKAVRLNLLTPYGIRTLAPDDPDYCKTCAGDESRRGRAHHQGTVWTWLLVPYLAALLRVTGDSKQAKEEFLAHIQPLLAHIEDRGLGFVSELFDGDPPHEARGPIAQAISVGSMLQLYEFLSSDSTVLREIYALTSRKATA